MTGENFVRSLMAPVPLEALMSVIQGGVPPTGHLLKAGHRYTTMISGL